MDLKTDAKKKVLEQIMSLMDENMGETLKSKSPKFKSEEILEAKEEKDEAVEMPESDEKSDEDLSDEDKDKLNELYEKYR